MNNTQKGEIAKLRTEIRAAEKGWLSSRTVEGARYDLVLDDGEKLYRAQVKWAGSEMSHSEGSVSVELRRYCGDGRNLKYTRSKSRVYGASEVDVVIAYIPQIDELCWFGPSMFDGKSTITVRFQPSKNGQKKGIVLAQDYVW